MCRKRYLTLVMLTVWSVNDGNLPETYQKLKKNVFGRFLAGFRQVSGRFPAGLRQVSGNPSLTDHTVGVACYTYYEFGGEDNVRK